MNGRKRFLRTTGILGCVFLVGCVAHAKYGTPRDNMMQAMQTDLKVDKALLSNPNTPQNINQALLQSTSAQLPNMPTAPEKRFDVSVKNAPAKSFFTGLVSGTPYNMIVSPDIAGNISIDLKDVTVQEALDAVRDLYGYDYQQTPYGFEVMPPSLHTEIFSVNYLDVQRNGHSTTSLSSGEVTSVGTQNSGGTSGSSGTTPTTSSANSSTPPSNSEIESTFKSDFWANLQTTLITMVGNEGGRQVVVNPQAGIVMVRGYPKDLRSVAEYLDSIQNHMNRQVILEAEILEVTLNDEFKTGVNWRLLGFSQGNPNLLPSITSNIPLKTNAFNTSSTTPPFTIFSSGSSNTTFQTLINLLETQGTVQVLSSPRVSAINNQQAIIKVGSSSFFVTSITSNTTPSNGSTSTSSSVGLTPFFSGITLDVTPQISHAGEIVLHVHPAISTVVDDTKSVDLGSQGTLKLPLARSTIRESDDIVRAKNGQVIVIGGLMSRSADEENQSAPGASRLPFIGGLFRSQDQTSNKTELVILLKPVVTNNKVWGQEIHKNIHEFTTVDRGYHVGSRPEIFGNEGEVND